MKKIIFVLCLFLSASVEAQTIFVGSATASNTICPSGCTVSGNLLIADGLIGSPSVQFASDADGTGTGIWRRGANVLAISANGIEQFGVSNGSVTVANTASLGFGSSGLGSIDLLMMRMAAANLQFGSNSATPIAQIFNLAPSSRAGTDTDVAGASAFIRPGNGTGTGGSGSIIFQTASVGASSTNANTMNSRWTMNSAGAFAPSTDNSMSIGTNTNRVTTVFPARLVTGAATPTIAGTGAGTTGVFSLTAGASDLAGRINISPSGTGIAATGTAVLTFSTANGAYGANGVACHAIYRNSSGSWNASAIAAYVTTSSTTSVTFTWNNNAVALTTAQAYAIDYICIGF